MTDKIKVMVVDDHVYIREGLRSCLAPVQKIEFVGEACNGFEALSQAEKLRPNVILMDIQMPGMNGLEATRQLRARVPECKVLILTVHEKREYVLQIMRSGASGCVLKASDPEELVKAILSVHSGGSFYSPAIEPFVGEAHLENAELTDRQIQLVALFGDGKSYKEIADQLGISLQSVKRNRNRILTRLRLSSTAALVKYAVEKGIVTKDDPIAT